MEIKKSILISIKDSDIQNGTITIPDDVTQIGELAFAWCENLKTIALPDSVAEIGDCAFFGCNSLTSIIIPNYVTKIGELAFAWCENLKTIALPDSVTEIGDYAFAWCENLHTIHWNRDYQVECMDSYCMEVLSKRYLDDMEILHCKYFLDGEECYVARQNDLCAHGATIKEAVSDLTFKKMQQADVSEHVNRVKHQGYVTPNDYRLITGACRQGTQRFLDANGYTWEDKLPIDEAIKLVENEWGGTCFKKLLAG